MSIRGGFLTGGYLGLLALAWPGLGFADEVLVASGGGDAVLRYDAISGQFQGVLVSAGSGGLEQPAGMCFGPEGDLYISSFGTDEVLRYDSGNGSFRDVFVAAGAGGLSGPSGLQFSARGSLWVVSRNSHAVLEYDGASGGFLSRVVGDDPATSGVDESGGLVDPRDLLFDAAGHLLLSSADGVLRFDGFSGTRRGRLRFSGSGRLNETHGLGMKDDGRGVVASTTLGSLHAFPLAQPPGLFDDGLRAPPRLLEPSGLAEGPDGRWWVADRGAHAILRFAADLSYYDTPIPSAAGGLDGPEALLFSPARRPRLIAPFGVSGGPANLLVLGAAPGAAVSFYESRRAGLDSLPDCGGLPSFLDAPSLLGTVVADAQGKASLPYLLDPAQGEEARVFQAVDPLECRTTSLALFRHPDSGSRGVSVIEPPGDIFNSSTYTAKSFKLRNSSSGGKKLLRVRMDLSSALLPDLVFDPFGTAGDVDAKDLDIDDEGGVGFVGHHFAQPHDGGFDVLVMDFDDFDNGEVILFSIDVDPTSIKGVAGPGPGHSGSISGLELVGSRVKFEFDDGSTKTRFLWRIDDSVIGSRIRLNPGQASAPRVEVLGLAKLPVVVTAAAQTVRVHGERGCRVSLLVVEAALFLDGVPGGGFDIEAFEANTALRAEQWTDVVGTEGYVDFPIVLQRTDIEGGLHHLVAVQLQDDGTAGRASSVGVLRYDGP